MAPQRCNHDYRRASANLAKCIYCGTYIGPPSKTAKEDHEAYIRAVEAQPGFAGWDFALRLHFRGKLLTLLFLRSKQP